MQVEQTLQAGDALLIVDTQNDFCTGGALEVPEGDRVVPILNHWMESAREAGIPIIASRDWHPVEHCSFEAQGGPWPEHCIQDTPPGHRPIPKILERASKRRLTTCQAGYSACTVPKHPTTLTSATVSTNSTGKPLHP